MFIISIFIYTIIFSIVIVALSLLFILLQINHYSYLFNFNFFTPNFLHQIFCTKISFFQFLDFLKLLILVCFLFIRYNYLIYFTLLFWFVCLFLLVYDKIIMAQNFVAINLCLCGICTYKSKNSSNFISTHIWLYM